MGIEPTCPDFRRDTPDLKSGSPTSELSTSNCELSRLRRNFFDRINTINKIFFIPACRQAGPEHPVYPWPRPGFRKPESATKSSRQGGQIHADINNLYIFNPKNLRSSASKMGFPILSSYQSQAPSPSTQSPFWPGSLCEMGA